MKDNSEHLINITFEKIITEEQEGISRQRQEQEDAAAVAVHLGRACTAWVGGGGGVT